MSYSAWSHPICRYCYGTLYPGVVPSRLKDPRMEICCKCGIMTAAGIYYRDDPKLLTFHETSVAYRAQVDSLAVTPTE